MNAPELKYKKDGSEIELAKYRNADVGYEDHGIIILYGDFDYLDSGGQGLGYCIDMEFIKRFITVFGVSKLTDCVGPVWVEHNMEKIHRIVSLNGRAEFDIIEWTEECKMKNEKNHKE